MPLLFRLQQALALTRSDATVLGTLLLLVALGAGARAWQADSLSFDPAMYEATDRALAAAEPLPSLPAGLPEPSALPEPEVMRAVVAVAERPRARRARVDPEPVNVNTASAEQLDALPGVGPALAARIIAYREAHGPFVAPEHLQRVKGIGIKTFAKMAPFVLVREAPRMPEP